MQDGLQKGNIDLNELVNELLKNREEKSLSTPNEVSAAVASTAETGMDTVAEPIVEPIEEPEVMSAEPLTAEAVETDETVAQSKPNEEEDRPEPKKKKSFFSWLRRRGMEDEDVLEEEWMDWGLKPIGWHDVEPPADEPTMHRPAEPTLEPIDEEPAQSEDTSSGREMPETVDTTVDESDGEAVEPVSAAPAVEPVTMVMPVVRPVVEDVTRVVEITAEMSAPVAPIEEIEESTALHLPDQLSLEELVRVEDVEDAPVQEDDEDAAVRLQRAREEKVKEFILGGDEEEENEPEEEVEDTPEEDDTEIEDFIGYDTTEAVQLELQYRWRTGLIGLLLTLGLEFVLVLLTLVTVNFGQSPITEIGYLTAHVFCLILMTVLNYTAVARGLSGLFTLRANNDTAPAVATVVSIAGLILHFINLDVTVPVFAPLAGLLMVFNAVGQLVKIARIRENFSFVSHRAPKYSAALIEEEKAMLEIGRRVAVDHSAEVAYFHRSRFLSSYLNNAYEEDGGDRFAKFGVPIAMGLSLALSLGLFAADRLNGFWQWMSTFVFMLCLSSFTTLFSLQMPMRSACRRMLRKGGFLVGWNAVDTFGCPDALAVDVADLYPDESMLLHGIKTFSGTHIDAAILDAASLSIRAGGPLSMIFRRIIQNKEELLHEVDSLVYEQGMGLSGWVDGRRVLVGNRRLLQNHGVDVPSSDYEARYAKNGRRLVYLSTAGELSAMFVVSYLPDAAIGDALHELCRAKVTLLVRTNDPNITAESLCRDFDLDDYYVDVLPAVAGRLYDQLIAQEQEETPALLASNGHILGTAMVLAVCRSLQVKSRIVLIVRILTAIAGLLICIPWALNSLGFDYFLPAFGMMLLTTLLGWMIPLFKRL